MDYQDHFIGVPLPIAVGKKLTTTGATTVYTAIGGNMIEAVDWLHVANITGATAKITIEWVDSSESTTFVVMKESTVPANTAVQFRLGFQLEASDVIQCTADTANALDVIAQIVQMARSS